MVNPKYANRDAEAKHNDCSCRNCRRGACAFRKLEPPVAHADDLPSTALTMRGRFEVSAIHPCEAKIANAKSRKRAAASSSGASRPMRGADVDELRSIFSLSASASESIKLFRIDRVAKIVSGDTPMALEAGAKMVTHILPLAAFTSRNLIDLNRALRDRLNLDGMLQSCGPLYFNVDGLLLSKSLANGSRYLQLFRNGCVEIITEFSVQESKTQNLQCPAFEGSIIMQVSCAKRFFENMGATPPIVVMLTLIGMKGWRIVDRYDESSGTFDRDPVFIPELVFETFGDPNQDEVKPLLDVVWNAAGSQGSPNYDAQGRRKTF